MASLSTVVVGAVADYARRTNCSRYPRSAAAIVVDSIAILDPGVIAALTTPLPDGTTPARFGDARIVERYPRAAAALIAELLTAVANA